MVARGDAPESSGSHGDIAVGDVVAERAFRLTRRDLLRYAGASGDFNPIHWSARVASAVGLPGVIGHGMLTMALAGRLLTDWLGDPAAVREYGVRFSQPVVVPDNDDGVLVHVVATVTAVEGDGTVVVKIDAGVDGGKVLTRAHAVVRLPDRDH